MNIHTLEDAKEALLVLSQASIIAIDTETDTIQPGIVPNVAGISIHTEVNGQAVSYYFVVNHKSIHAILLPPINLPPVFYEMLSQLTEKPDIEWIFQNAKFDLPVLKKVGVHVRGQIHDTMVYAHMADENRRVGLEKLAIEYFGEDEVQWQDKIKRLGKKFDNNYSLIPPEILGPYSEEDARLTWMLYWELIKEIEQQEMLHLLPDEMEFLLVLQGVEEDGVKVDRPKCLELAQTARRRLKEIQAELGFDPMKPDQLESKLFATPPVGLGFRPVEFGSRRSSMFPMGMPLMPKALLKGFQHPVTDMVLEYRGHVKALSTWFEAFALLADSNGRLHPSYNQAPHPKSAEGGTLTGRLSCSKPNLQQIPRTLEEEEEQGISKAFVKRLFLAREGHTLISYDFSQLELRLAACYGRDKDMVEAFKINQDMHQLTADKVGINRFSGKTLNFTVLYGGGSNKVSELLDISEDEAKQILLAFWRAYPGLAKTKWEATQAATSRGWVRLWTGRRRHFPESYLAHKAFNSIIQGGAGEIVKQAMLRVSRLEGYREDFFIVNQVHDDVWIECKTSMVEHYSPTIRRELEWATMKFNVPFPVDMKVMHVG